MFSTILFGGSFDPPHLGHQAIVEATLNRFPESKIIVIPAADPPHKQGKVNTPFSDRFEMCELAFKEFRRVSVSRVEESLPKPSYTFQTVQYLKSSLNGKLALLIGGDSLSSFSKWYRFKDLLNDVSLIVYPRDSNTTKIPKELSAYRDKIVVLSAELLCESSTEVRNGREELVSDAVKNFIQMKGLYQT